MYIWLKRLIFFSVFLLIIIFLLVFSFYYLTPFIIAVLLASLINPAVNFTMVLFRVDRSLAVFLVLFFFISLFIFFIIIGLTQVYIELLKLIRNLPDYNLLGDEMKWLLQHNNRLEDIILNLKLSPIIKETLNNNLQLLYNTVKESIIFISNYLLITLRKLPLILSVLLLSCIATYFISRDLDIINAFIMGLFPASIKEKIFVIEKELINSAIGFIRAEFILILITGISTSLGLICIGSNYALSLGIMAAFLDLIPIIGPGLMFIPWIIFNILSADFLFSFKLLLVYTIVAIIRQGIEGKIIGKQLGIHPLAAMIVFYIGYRLLGTIGIIIGPAVLVLVRVIYKSDMFSDWIGFKE